MANFQAWLDQADMPVNQNGGWYDLETGLAYDPALDYANARKPRAQLGEKAAAARASAKLFGGKALKGTAKQKEWAEKIRAEKLLGMTQEQAEMACDPKGLLTNSKFWIENRMKSAKEIGNFVMTQKALLKQAQTLRQKNEADAYAKVAAEYNALTTVWGF